MSNLYSILKSRDITLPTKVHLVKAMVFPVVMYGCESWTIKKAEHQRTDAFELWCWKRLLRVPWSARGSKQSILKEINPEYSLKGLMLKLKVQHFGHLMQRTDSLEKTLMLGKIEGRRRKGQQRIRWVDDITDSMDVSLSEHWELVIDREALRAAVHGVTKSDATELLNWTELTDAVGRTEAVQGVATRGCCCSVSGNRAPRQLLAYTSANGAQRPPAPPVALFSGSFGFLGLIPVPPTPLSPDSPSSLPDDGERGECGKDWDSLCQI